MAYVAQLINRFSQFGRTEYDVLLTDDAGVMADRRLSVAISKPFSDITAGDLTNLRTQMRAAALAQHNDEQQALTDRTTRRTAIQAAIDICTASRDAAPQQARKAAYQTAIDICTERMA